jgi:precorrin-6A synthase
VMLDAGFAPAQLADPDLYVYWGAYLGTPDEVLLAGRLVDIAAKIEQTKQALRAQHGWIMDTYLVRREGRSRSAE